MQSLWPEIYAIIHQRLQYSVKEIGGGKKIRGLAIRPVFGKFGKTQQNSLKFGLERNRKFVKTKNRPNLLINWPN
jgi:hypothetical protein